jgi:hypothetical protein
MFFFPVTKCATRDHRPRSTVSVPVERRISAVERINTLAPKKSDTGVCTYVHAKVLSLRGPNKKKINLISESN